MILQSTATPTSVTARWIATVIASVLVAAVGLLIGLGMMADLASENERARSTAATILMTLGLFGPFVPAAIARARGQFARMSNAGQWAMLAGVPLVHLAVIAVLILITISSASG